MPTIDLKQYPRKPVQKKTTPTTEDTGGLLALLNKDISFGGKELSDKKKEGLYLELGSLLTAGINFKDAFELICQDQQKGKDKALFDGINQAVLKGMALSAALQQAGRFSLYEVYSIQIGEETGKMIEVLQELARFYTNKIKQRRKIVSALTYPIVVLCTSLGAVFFMLKFVVPMFGDVFKRFGGQLPWITEKIISLSQALEQFFWPTALIIRVP